MQLRVNRKKLKRSWLKSNCVVTLCPFGWGYFDNMRLNFLSLNFWPTNVFMEHYCISTLFWHFQIMTAVFTRTHGSSQNSVKLEWPIKKKLRIQVSEHNNFQRLLVLRKKNRDLWYQSFLSSFFSGTGSVSHLFVNIQ